MTVWAPGLDDGKHLEVIEVALGKRKLVERSEEEGVWGRSGLRGETLHGFLGLFCKKGVPFLGGLLTAFSLPDGSKT